MNLFKTPEHVLHTVQWLIEREDYKAAHQLIASLRPLVAHGSFAETSALMSLFHMAKSYEMELELGQSQLNSPQISSEFVFNMIFNFICAGNFTEAEDLLNKAALHTSELEVPLYGAVLRTAQGRREEAVQILATLQPALSIRQDHLGQIYSWLRSWYDLDLSLGRKVGTVSIGSGQTVLVQGEGSLSEELFFARYARALVARGCRVHWRTKTSRVELLSWVSGIDLVTTENAESVHSTFDQVISCLDLPACLGIKDFTLFSEPYLNIPATRASVWQQQMASAGLLKVGVSWLVERERQDCLRASMTYNDLKVTCSLPGIRYFSLQRDEGFVVHPAVDFSTDFKDQLDSWTQLACAMSQVDVFVGPCSAAAMIASALGKTVFCVAPFFAPFPWNISNDQMVPWSLSSKIFKQRQIGAWDAPLRELQDHLRILAAQKRPTYEGGISGPNLTWQPFKTDPVV